MICWHLAVTMLYLMMLALSCDNVVFDDVGT